MRVLTVGNMYPPHHLGGYELVWQGAVGHLRAQGHDVTVLTTTTRVHADAPADPPHVHRELPWFWADHGFPPVTRREARRIDRDARRTLATHLDRGPDVVLWWSMGGLPLSLLAEPRRRGIASGAVVHDAWPVYGPAVDAWMARAGGRGPAFDAVDAWSFNSAFVRDGVRRAHPGIPPTRCRVDPPGVDADRLVPASAGPWGGRLAVVGRLDARKGTEHAVEALATLDDATLVLTGAGDPSVLAGLRELAGRLGVAERIRFDGPTDDVGAVYAAADAVVFPVTWDEPFGLVPLEAMAVGRPVVATATGGASEYLRDGVNALVVPVGDGPAIGRAVRRLAEDPALRARLVEGGAVTAREHPAARFEAAVETLARELAAVPAAGPASPGAAAEG